jgi:hypothetical protein
MEVKLLRVIMNPAMIASWVFGLLLVAVPGVVDFSAPLGLAEASGILAMTGFTCGWRGSAAAGGGRAGADRAAVPADERGADRADGAHRPLGGAEVLSRAAVDSRCGFPYLRASAVPSGAGVSVETELTGMARLPHEDPIMDQTVSTCPI